MPAIEDGLERPQLAINAEDALAGLDPRFGERRALRRRQLFDFRQRPMPVTRTLTISMGFSGKA
jgi:hypothetical protein